MKSNDIRLRLMALGAAMSLCALVLGSVAVVFDGASSPRALPDPIPPIASAAPDAAPIPVEIMPGRIEVRAERSTETAESTRATAQPGT
jgi:hypothetical protein